MDEYDPQVMALAEFLGCDPEDIQEEGSYYTYGKCEYRVLTDEEADEAAESYILDSLWAFNDWFLADMTDLPSAIFEALQPQCENANDAIFAVVAQTCGVKAFVEAAISADGRGHFLNFWDGSEDEIECDGEWYYIYRVN